MEDIIPLLIVIAISVIGAFRNKNKRKKPENSTPEQEERNNDVFDWLEKIVDDDEQQEENIPYATETETTYNDVENNKIQEIREEKSNKPSNKYERFSGFITHEEKEKNKEDKRNEVAKDREQDRNTLKKPKQKKKKTAYRDFNPKQAIIYSEIINRKYQ
ncbi:MAG TPA: hypothetical protein VJ909_05100 [Prolixibacteraceae bacterium]|nr:hypothetical protein [Prolixibacteraceae bacterium]